jgi:rubredoxin-NAD+ reductase
MQRIVIIGAGMAGYMTATEMRKQLPSSQITLISADEAAYYSKPLLSTGIARAKQAQDLVISTGAQMAERLDMTVLPHTAVERIDSANHCVETAKQSIPYDVCIVAIGSETIALDHAQPAAGLLSVNSLDDYRHFRAKLESSDDLAIIGSGLVGVEFAHDVASGGQAVSVIGMDDYPLARLLPEALGRALQTAMQEQLGIQWYNQTAITSVTHEQERYRIHSEAGVIIEVDQVLSAVGIRANLALAHQSGLATNQGIVVDAFGRTSAADVYAVGDCAEVGGLNLHYVPPIRQCAAAIAATCAGEETAIHYPAMPVTLKTPVCPVVACVPRTSQPVRCHISGEGQNLVARYEDEFGVLHGFALSGEAVQEKMALAAQVTAWV